MSDSNTAYQEVFTTSNSSNTSGQTDVERLEVKLNLPYLDSTADLNAPHRPEPDGKYILYTEYHRRIKYSMSQCTGALFDWLLFRAPGGANIDIDLRDFRADSAEWRKKPYSMSAIYQAKLDLESMGLLTVTLERLRGKVCHPGPVVNIDRNGHKIAKSKVAQKSKIPSTTEAYSESYVEDRVPVQNNPPENWNSPQATENLTESGIPENWNPFQKTGIHSRKLESIPENWNPFQKTGIQTDETPAPQGFANSSDHFQIFSNSSSDLKDDDLAKFEILKQEEYRIKPEEGEPNTGYCPIARYQEDQTADTTDEPKADREDKCSAAAAPNIQNPIDEPGISETELDDRRKFLKRKAEKFPVDRQIVNMDKWLVSQLKPDRWEKEWAEGYEKERRASQHPNKNVFTASEDEKAHFAKFFRPDRDPVAPVKTEAEIAGTSAPPEIKAQLAAQMAALTAKSDMRRKGNRPDAAPGMTSKQAEEQLRQVFPRGSYYDLSEPVEAAPEVIEVATSPGVGQYACEPGGQPFTVTAASKLAGECIVLPMSKEESDCLQPDSLKDIRDCLDGTEDESLPEIWECWPKPAIAVAIKMLSPESRTRVESWLGSRPC